MAIPLQFEELRDKLRQVLKALRPPSTEELENISEYDDTKRTKAGQQLPPYYLVYFLLVDLLEYPDLGYSEKVAWTIPLVFEEQTYRIEHRKMGLGFFAEDAIKAEPHAVKVVSLIKKAVKLAEPYFLWRADESVKQSKLSVINKGQPLFARFQFLQSAFYKLLKDVDHAQKEREKLIKEQTYNQKGKYHRRIKAIHQQANWTAQSAIEAFFNWTEHIFIHLAILQGKVTTGLEIIGLADKNWFEKFKMALDISDPVTNQHYEQLTEIRRQHRNFVAHGSFGKQKEAFYYHSSVGAVPVVLPGKAYDRFTLRTGFDLTEYLALVHIESFIKHLWSGSRAPAQIYIQQSELALILPMAIDGTYARAMQSIDAMETLVEDLNEEAERAVDMDW